MKKVLYLIDSTSEISKEGACIVIKSGEGRLKIPISYIEAIVIMNTIEITIPILNELIKGNIDIYYCDYYGHLIGKIDSLKPSNISTKLLQYKVVQDNAKKLEVSKKLIKKKIEGQFKVLYRLNNREEITSEYKKHIFRINNADDINSLLGIEGSFARFYFKHYFSMFKDYSVENRVKMKPNDPINSLMNLTYAFTITQLCIEINSFGFDNAISTIHSIQDGRLNLAYDLIEPLRAKCDSFVISLLNRHEIKVEDFSISKDVYYLKHDMIKMFINKFNLELLPRLEIDQLLIDYRNMLMEENA